VLPLRRNRHVQPGRLNRTYPHGATPLVLTRRWA
jgi:hypothetical protein